MNIQRFFKFQRHVYLLRNYYYAKLFNKYIDANSYKSLKDSVLKKLKILSKREIAFNDKESGSFTKKEVLNYFGKPTFVIIPKNTLKTEIMFYRVFIGGHKVKLEMHLDKHSLFYFSYTFSHLKNDEKHQVIKLLELKYIEGQTFDYENYVIMDDKDSTISIVDTIDLKINYICSINTGIFKSIDAIISSQIKCEANKQKNSLNDLFKKL